MSSYLLQMACVRRRRERAASRCNDHARARGDYPKEDYVAKVTQFTMRSAVENVRRTAIDNDQNPRTVRRAPARRDSREAWRRVPHAAGAT
ncbi:hypothetical protein JCM9533A_19100 [Catenuloplanes niger JCM 9533]